VNPSPGATVSNAAPNICDGELTDLTLFTPTFMGVIELVSVDYAGGNVTGTLSGGETYSDGQKIEELLINTTDNIQIVTYTFRADAESCGPTANIVETVTVNPDPSMSITNTLPTVCEGTALDITLNTPTENGVVRLITVDYASGNITGGTVGPGDTFNDGDQITDALSNITSSTQTVTYTFDVSANTCGPNGPFVTTVDVKPVPAFTVTNNVSDICSGSQVDIDLTSTTGTSIITLDSINYGGGSGTLSNGATFTPGSNISEVVINATNAPITATYTFSVAADGCTNPVTQQAIINVDPIPSFTITNNAAVICDGDPVDLDIASPTSGAIITLDAVNYGAASGSFVGGETFTNGSNISEVITNATDNPVTITYTFSVAANGCNGLSTQNVNVLVNPSANFTVTSNNNDICSGAQVDIDLNSSTASAIITLDDVDYGAASGTLTNGTTFTPGSNISEVITNVTNAPVTVTYTFSVAASGCNNLTTQQAVINVDPIPSFTVTNNAAVICDGDQVDLDIASPTSGAIITLDAVNYGAASGGFVGGETFTNGNTINEVITNVTDNPVTITYTLKV